MNILKYHFPSSISSQFMYTNELYLDMKLNVRVQKDIKIVPYIN